MGVSDYSCPYCDREANYEGDPIGDGEEVELECDGCGKVFVVEASVSISYSTRCVEDQHDYGVPLTERSGMRYVTCKRCRGVKILE